MCMPLFLLFVIVCPFRIFSFNLRFLFFKKAFQQECEEIGEGIELAVPTDIFVTEFDTILHIPINHIFGFISHASSLPSSIISFSLTVNP